MVWQNFKQSIRLRQERGNNGVLVWYPEGLPRAGYQNRYNGVLELLESGADRSYAKQKWTAARFADVRGHKESPRPGCSERGLYF